MLRLEQMERRDLPAFVAAAGGEVFVDGRQYRPFADYTGPLYVASAGDITGDGIHDILIGAGEGGGPRFEVRDGRTDRVIADLFAFEPDFRGGVRVAGDGDRIYVGTGPGGGPMVAAYDARTLAEVGRAFVGDPASRTGVTLDGIAPLPSLLTAKPHPAMPGDPAQVNAALAKLPVQVQQLLLDAGQTVYVYGGAAVTQLPEFARMAGLRTPYEGDAGRTWDAVPAAYTPGAVYVRAGEDPATVVHEVGHAVEFGIDEADRARWRSLHAQVVWPTLYEARNETEAFAESFRRWAEGIRQPSLGVDPYFNALFRTS